MPQSPPDPEQTTDVDELLESSGCINPNVGVTIAPMSDNRHRRNASNISKFTFVISTSLDTGIKKYN